MWLASLFTTLATPLKINPLIFLLLGYLKYPIRYYVFYKCWYKDFYNNFEKFSETFFRYIFIPISLLIGIYLLVGSLIIVLTNPLKFWL